MSKDRKKDKHKKDTNISFWSKYKLWLFTSIMGATILYVIVYLVFGGDEAMDFCMLETTLPKVIGCLFWAHTYLSLGLLQLT